MAAPLLPIVLSLAQYAPTVLRHLGAGEKTTAVAERVVAVAQAVTGTDAPDAALQRIQQDPAAAQAFQQRVVELDAELERDHLADRQDARKRDIALAQAGQHNRRADLMVLLDVVGLIACLVVLALFRKEIPAEVAGLLTTIASLFGLCLRDAHQFEFGSSRGSREKDNLLAGVNPPAIRGNPGAAD